MGDVDRVALKVDKITGNQDGLTNGITILEG